MKPLGYAPQARRDLALIGKYIAREHPERARTFVAELVVKAEQVAKRPFSFPARNEISPGLRSAVHGKHLLFFREMEEEVRIVRILHGARNLGGVAFD